MADLLIHVRDVSNPDHFSQNQHVLQTLRNLDVPENLIRSMITIGNKSDLVSEGDWNYIRYMQLFVRIEQRSILQTHVRKLKISYFQAIEITIRKIQIF